MRLSALATAFLIAAVIVPSPHAGEAIGLEAGMSLNPAAAFYHQGRLDSALARLESLKSQGPWRHKDSVTLFQYLGMASARLGREDSAVAYFSRLLELDSLFQFPTNENPQVLRAFAKADGRRPDRQVAAESRSVAEDGTVAEGESAAESGRAAKGDSTLAMSIGPGSGAHSPVPAPAGRFSLVDSCAPGAGDREGSRSPQHGRIGLAMGALPFGAGWFAGRRTGHGVALGLLQAGGLALSVYASGRQSREQGDAYRVMDEEELSSVRSWQWVQRVSLSTALGAYLFSLIASAGD